MFRNTFQSGFFSILYSIGSNPLQLWEKRVQNGSIKRITDEDIQSLVLELVGANVSTCLITCPAVRRQSLAIKLPFLVLIVKNLNRFFTFEVELLDDKRVKRRFRASSFQRETRVQDAEGTTRGAGAGAVGPARQRDARVRPRRVRWRRRRARVAERTP